MTLVFHGATLPCACYPDVGQHVRGDVCACATDSRFKSWEVPWLGCVDSTLDVAPEEEITGGQVCGSWGPLDTSPTSDPTVGEPLIKK